MEAAVKQYLPNLATSGQVLVFQNGLCEERVAAAINHSHPVLGGVVSWGATHDGGGRGRKNHTGSHHLGRPRADVGEPGNGKRPECDRTHSAHGESPWGLAGVS